MEKDKINSIIINENSTIKEAMQNIDFSGLSMCIVTDDQKKIKGVLSDGDIRRTIIEGYPIETKIEKIMNKNPITIKQGYSKEEIINKKISGKIPIINDNDEIVDLAIIPEPKIRLLSESKFNNEISKVLITGGAGYLGSILSRKLLERGYKVKIIDNLTYGDDSIKELYNNSNFELIKGDIRHIETITKNIEDIQAVIHLAGIVGDPACGLSSKQTIEQNLLSTQNLAQICKHFQINRFIFASSCSVYGESNELLDENSELNPVSLYARDKIGSEKAILNLMDENFSPTILRMGTLYGKSYRPRFDLVLNTLTAYATKEKEFSIFGGEQWRPMLHVSNAAEAYIAALESPIDKVKGEIFNVGSEEENYKIVDLGRNVQKLIPESNMKIDEKDVDLRNYRVNFQKIKNTLEFLPKKTIKDGILEINKEIEENIIENFKDPKYNNFKFLENKSKKTESMPIHQNTYDSLAQEYNSRWRSYIPHQKEVLRPFKEKLKEEFNEEIKILDVGCGVGLDLYLLDKEGFETYGMDISKEMIKHAQINVPNGNFKVSNFLNENMETKFNGVIMDAFIHLFPKEEVPEILKKLKSILNSRGYAYISTTKSNESKEGFIQKEDYKEKLQRFRKFWTREEMIEMIEKNGFKIISFYEDYQPEYGKQWMNAIVQKIE